MNGENHLVRIKAFCIAIVLSIISVVAFLFFYIPYINSYYKVTDNSIRYGISQEKYKSVDIIKENLDKNTLVLFGSSELEITNHKEYSFNKVFNTDDFHIMQIGSGNYQNIIHAAMMGALGDSIPKKKIAIVESMQWFEENDQNRKAFASKVSKEAVYGALTNEKLSLDTKTKLIDRIISLSSENKSLKETFERYKRVLVDKEPLPGDEWIMQVDLMQYNQILKSGFAKNKKSFGPKGVKSEKAADIDWAKLEDNAVKDAEKNTQDNPFDMDDATYKKYYADKVSKVKDSKKNVNFENAAEFDDFKLFLQIAKELGIETKVVLFPVNGKWYDHLGLNKETREKYYSKMKSIIESYGASAWDLSSKEYEQDYMHDGIHPGWKSWIETNKALYDFFNK